MYRKILFCFCLVFVVIFIFGQVKAADEQPRLQVDGPKENRLSITLRDPKSAAEPVVLIGGKQAKLVPGSLKTNPDKSEFFQVEVPSDIKPGKTTLEVKVGEESIKPELLIDIPDPGSAAGKSPVILKVEPAGGLPGATIKITGQDFGNDRTKITVVIGDKETGVDAISISEPDNEKPQELVFAIPLAGSAQFRDILANSSIYKNAWLTLNLDGHSNNWTHLNVVHPDGLWRIAGLSLAIVILLLIPFLALLWWWGAVASVALLGGFLLYSLSSDYCWLLAVLFIVAALGLLLAVDAKRDALKPLLGTLFIDNATNTYSLSKVQAFAWTVVIIGTYVYFAIGRGLIVGKAEIPDLDPGLLSLMSISYGGLILSRGISNTNPKNDFASTPPQWTDLFTEGNTISITRLQLVGFSIAAIAVYLFYVSGADLFAKGLPVIPVTLSGLMGISQGGYLGGKIINNRAVNYIIPRRLQMEPKGNYPTLKIFGSGFKDQTKVLIQGGLEASEVKQVNSNYLEVKLPDNLGDAGWKQMTFVPPADSSFVIDNAFELIDPKIESAVKLGSRQVVAIVTGIRLAEGELKATIDKEPADIVKKEGNKYTLESTKADLTAGSKLSLVTTGGDIIGTDVPIAEK